MTTASRVAWSMTWSRRSTASRLSPCSYSMTRYEVPLASKKRSTETMLGWRKATRVAASCRKRSSPHLKSAASLPLTGTTEWSFCCRPAMLTGRYSLIATWRSMAISVAR